MFGRAVVGTAWVDYEPGSVLEYHELMVAVLVHDGWRIRPSVTSIWVDSAASRTGGRQLWGVPKDLADFAIDETSVVMTTGAVRVAATTSLGGSLGRWPVRFAVVQRLEGQAKVTPVRARARVRLSRTRWEGLFPGRRPVLGVSLTDFVMRFGAGS
jgi:hypothetical protein